MELKQRFPGTVTGEGGLLIVPYGIETIQSDNILCRF